jgi:hypothetical protein
MAMSRTPLVTTPCQQALTAEEVDAIGEHGHHQDAE